MPDLREILAKKLTEKEKSVFRHGFDTIGDIAIIEIPPELKKKQKIIANAVLEHQPNIKVVLKKSGMHSGRYRTQKLVYVAGERRTLTVHRECGVQMKVDAGRVYFSPRLSAERLRIAQMIKPGEQVLVMFSGVAPYPLVFARNSKAEKIIGIELNPAAHKLAVENVAFNKLGHKILLFKGDVSKVVPKLGQKFDRIVMPLPQTAEAFLGSALKAAKKGSVIHFYTFAPEESLSDAEGKVLKACKSNGIRCKILRTVRAGQYSPRKFRVCVDFSIR
jgi:tRNA (guanine37-N1)-methyltransferase